jgi:ElaB/YqjD/DUF883 family membrane-anchored ribosome-binding protein
MAEKIEDKKINEALELLNESAKEKKAELLGMVAGKYSNLKSALGLGAGGAAEKLRAQAREGYALGEEKVKEFASKADDAVHKNPWRYIGGAALGFLILGYLLGRSKK